MAIVDFCWWWLFLKFKDRVLHLSLLYLVLFDLTIASTFQDPLGCNFIVYWVLAIPLTCLSYTNLINVFSEYSPKLSKNVYWTGLRTYSNIRFVRAETVCLVHCCFFCSSQITFDGLNWKKCVSSLVWHQAPLFNLTQTHFYHPWMVHKLIGLFSHSPNAVILTVRISIKTFVLVLPKVTIPATIPWFVSLVTLVKKGKEVVRDTWLLENLVHADTCSMSGWSFSKCLQSGPLKIHWRLILRITFETTPSIQFWKLKGYLFVFCVSSKVSGLWVVFSVIYWAWKTWSHCRELCALSKLLCRGLSLDLPDHFFLCS